MKNLYISEILLLSRKERKAKRVLLNKHRTLIIGANHTGKSSLIKCIYYTFGAEPFFSSNFKDAQVICSVKFELDNREYQIIRDGKKIAIFDNIRLLESFDSISKGLAPYFSDLFDFNPAFQSNNGTFILPPPAYLLLPYYIDQDESWVKSWASFKNLAQIKDYRSSCVFYHSGIRPNKYYELKKEIDKYRVIIDETNKEQKVTSKILQNLKEKISQSDFNIDIDAFNAEIADLLAEFEKLKAREEKIKSELHDLYHSKAAYDIQLKIIMQAISESHSDLQYMLNELPSVINCPTCGAQYDNSFAERFEIAQDEQKCRELYLEIKRESAEVLILIQGKKRDLNNTVSESVRVEEILQSKKGEITLKDIIESSGKNKVNALFAERYKELNTTIVENSLAVRDLEAKLKAVESKERRETIVKYYQNTLQSFLNKLDVTSISMDNYKDIKSKIENIETGSSRPRALTAYYFAFFHLMREFSKTTYFPLVVDSPNQQDQDDKHVKDIMVFINENQPENSQLILGLTNTFDIDFDCEQIVLNEKYHLLQESDFDDVNEELQGKIFRMWNDNPSELNLFQQ